MMKEDEALDRVTGKMFNSKDHSDIIFKVGENRIYALTYVLKVRCSGLNEFVIHEAGEEGEKDKRMYAIENFSSAAFSTFLRVIYSFPLNFQAMENSVGIAVELLALARIYQVQDIDIEAEAKSI